MKYTSTINHASNTWQGTAEIPLSYIPRGVNKMNAYAIHGTGANRTYWAANKVGGTAPNFHQLQSFFPLVLIETEGKVYQRVVYLSIIL